MGLFGNSEKKEAFTLRNGGNVANGGKTLPDVEINSPKTFEEFGINLEPKNGEVHSMMYITYLIYGKYGINDIYAEEVEKLTSLMQKDGYSILDIKMSFIKENEYFIHIMYK